MMVLVTQGVVEACSAAKAMGTRAEARRRIVLVNCIAAVGCVLLMLILISMWMVDLIGKE